jgi:CheY-like chemotaxis protein
MLSALTLLLDTALDPEQLELAHVIQEAGGILLQVINDILDYSKLASGCFSISKDIINVPEIIQSIFRAHEKTVKPSITLVSYIDPKLPKAAEGDSLRYRQIVQNLVSNATKFTEEGYVHINARLLEEDDDYYTILTEVIDSGIGVPADLSGSLFTPFMQFDNSATKRYKGTGLGLSICKSLAELMGGKIGFLRNPDDHGSIFWFTARMKKVKKLKVIDALQEELEALAQSTSVSPLEDIRSVAVDKRILLAEDNPINQKVMLKMLTSLGFKNIDLATDGREAVALATKDPPPYHAILMDINMPVLDGVAATKELRDAGIKTPIIAMTANALKGQADLYLAKGMDGYVAKPVDRKLLITILLTWLNPLTPLHDEQELKPAMGGKSVSNESDTASGPQSLTEQVKNVIRNLSPKVAAPEVVYSSQQPTPGSLPPPAPGGHGSSILDTLKAYIIPNNPQEPVSKYDKAPLKPIVASVLEQNETTPGPHLSDAIYSYISSAKFQQSALYSPSFRPKLDSSSKPTTPAPEPSTSETSNTHINPSKPHSPASTDRQSTQQQSAPTTPAVQTLVSEPSTLDGTNAYLVSTTIQEPAPKDETPSEILTTDSLSSPTAPAQEPSTDLKNAYVMPTNIQEAPTTPTPEPSTSDFKNAHIMPAKIQELVSNDQTPPEKPRVDSLSTPTAAPAGTSTADEPVAYITSTTLQEQPLLGGPSLQEHTVDSLPTPMTPAPDSFVVGDMTPRHEATKLQEPVSASVEVLTPPADVPTDSATPFPHYV